MSGFILQLVSVFLLFDGNPQNLVDPTFRAYGCQTSLIVRPGAGGSFPVACTVWYDASAGRESEFFVETAQPRLGQVLMGCVFSFDRSKNRSECVAPDFGQGLPSKRGERVGEREPFEGEGEESGESRQIPRGAREAGAGPRERGRR